MIQGELMSLCTCLQPGDSQSKTNRSFQLLLPCVLKDLVSWNTVLPRNRYHTPLEMLVTEEVEGSPPAKQAPLNCAKSPAFAACINELVGLSTIWQATKHMVVQSRSKCYVVETEIAYTCIDCLSIKKVNFLRGERELEQLLLLFFLHPHPPFTTNCVLLLEPPWPS